MTEEEAHRVAKICSQADGGCPVCVGNLEDYLKNDFPEHKDIWEQMMDMRFD